MSHGSNVDDVAGRCHDFGRENALVSVSFETFVRADGPRLRAALVAAYGTDRGAEAVADALAYGWQHWERIGSMDNPVGYLYRVAQRSALRDAPRRIVGFAAPPVEELPRFEPRLLPALAELSEQQRVAVVLVHGYGWPIVEVAALLDVTHSTVRTHLARALAHLQTALEVHSDVN